MAFRKCDTETNDAATPMSKDCDPVYGRSMKSCVQAGGKDCSVNMRQWSRGLIGSSKIKSESILKIDPSIFKIVNEKEIKDKTGEFEISDGVGFAGSKIFEEFNAKYAFAAKNSKVRHISDLQAF